MTVYRRRLLCLILVLSMIITLVPAATGSNTAARAASVRKGITLMDKVNVRYGAGTNEKIIFSLPFALISLFVCQSLSSTSHLLSELRFTLQPTNV